MKQPSVSRLISQPHARKSGETTYALGGQTIAFMSHVAELHRGSLEMLVYFNAGQSRVLDEIVDAVERFGTPEIVADGDRLRLHVPGLPEAQCLFAIEAATGRPLGVAVYARPDLEHMIVVHLGIAAEFASGGKRSHEHLLMKLLRELHQCSRRIKGVQRFELFYLSGRSRARIGNELGLSAQPYENHTTAYS